jgi:hypothetical protein
MATRDELTIICQACWDISCGSGSKLRLDQVRGGGQVLFLWGHAGAVGVVSVDSYASQSLKNIYSYMRETNIQLRINPLSYRRYPWV